MTSFDDLIYVCIWVCANANDDVISRCHVPKHAGFDDRASALGPEANDAAHAQTRPPLVPRRCAESVLLPVRFYSRVVAKSVWVCDDPSELQRERNPRHQLEI